MHLEQILRFRHLHQGRNNAPGLVTCKPVSTPLMSVIALTSASIPAGPADSIFTTPTSRLLTSKFKTWSTELVNGNQTLLKIFSP